MTVDSGLLLRGNRIVVPQQLQKETLEKIHSGHQGMRNANSGSTDGHVRKPTFTPRSYMMETSSGVLQCNQVHVTP